MSKLGNLTQWVVNDNLGIVGQLPEVRRHRWQQSSYHSASQCWLPGAERFLHGCAKLGYAYLTKP